MPPPGSGPSTSARPLRFPLRPKSLPESGNWSFSPPPRTKILFSSGCGLIISSDPTILPHTFSNSLQSARNHANPKQAPPLFPTPGVPRRRDPGLPPHGSIAVCPARPYRYQYLRAGWGFFPSGRCYLHLYRDQHNPARRRGGTASIRIRWKQLTRQIPPRSQELMPPWWAPTSTATGSGCRPA